MSLKDMQHRVLEVNVANGWFDGDRTFGEDVALLHSEVSEMLEAFREHGTEDQTAPDYGPIVTAEVDEYTGEEYIEESYSPPPKPEGVGSEAADVLIRLLDTCERYSIDLEAEFERKVAYNATRGHRHGGKRL